MYHIERGVPFDPEHLLSAKLLIDYSAAFEALDAVLRSGDKEKIAEVAHLARILTETVQCFGSVFSDKMTCYKVLSQPVFFTSFVIGVYEPLIAYNEVKYKKFSKSRDHLNAFCPLQSDAAIDSVREKGLGLMLQFSKGTDRLDVMCFDCAPFSILRERKILFFGGNTILKVSSIEHLQQKTDKKMMPSAIQVFLDMIRGHSVRGKVITTSQQDGMRAVIRNVLCRHSGQLFGGYMMDLIMFNLNRASKVRLLYSELVTEYQWLHSIFKFADSQGNVLDIANIAVLFWPSDIITFVLGETDLIGETERQSVVSQVAAIYDMGLTTTICFEFPAETEWHQHMMYNAAFNVFSKAGSKWECAIKMQENVLSFECVALSIARNEIEDAAQSELIQEHALGLIKKLA